MCMETTQRTHTHTLDPPPFSHAFVTLNVGITQRGIQQVPLENRHARWETFHRDSVRESLTLSVKFQLTLPLSAVLPAHPAHQKLCFSLKNVPRWNALTCALELCCLSFHGLFAY